MADGEILRFPALQKSVNQCNRGTEKQTDVVENQTRCWLALRVSEIQARKQKNRRDSITGTQ